MPTDEFKKRTDLTAQFSAHRTTRRRGHRRRRASCAEVHAANDTAAGFDRHYGFEPSPVDALTLMLLVMDIAY